MPVYQRGATITERKGGRFNAALGGVPNVPCDVHGNLCPMENEIDVDLSHPVVRYVIRRGPFDIGFHNKNTNKYLCALRLRTGETLKITLPDAPACTPTVRPDKRTLEWSYPNGSWIRQYATERWVKEVIKQKAATPIKFKYAVSGLVPRKNGQQVDFLRGKHVAFSIERPHYTNADGDWLGYVPVSWQKVGNDWEVTLAAPAEDRLVDPTVTFGDGGQMFGGDHKDTEVRGLAVTSSFGANALVIISDNGGAQLYLPFFRFSLTGHIPTNAIVSAAVFTMVQQAFGANANFSAHRLLTDWGVTPVDAGINQTPAVLSQATLNYSFQTGAAAGTPWAAGVGYTVADQAAAETTVAWAALPVINNYSIPIMTQAWVLSDATNYGLCIRTDTNNAGNRVHTSEAVALANRPYLTVDYDLPRAASGKNAIALGNGMGMSFG